MGGTGFFKRKSLCHVDGELVRHRSVAPSSIKAVAIGHDGDALEPDVAGAGVCFRGLTDIEQRDQHAAVPQ